MAGGAAPHRCRAAGRRVHAGDRQLPQPPLAGAARIARLPARRQRGRRASLLAVAGRAGAGRAAGGVRGARGGWRTRGDGPHDGTARRRSPTWTSTCRAGRPAAGAPAAESAEVERRTRIYRKIMGLSGYRRELDIVVEAENGDLAACCTCWLDEDKPRRRVRACRLPPGLPPARPNPHGHVRGDAAAQTARSRGRRGEHPSAEHACEGAVQVMRLSSSYSWTRSTAKRSRARGGLLVARLAADPTTSSPLRGKIEMGVKLRWTVGCIPPSPHQVRSKL